MRLILSHSARVSKKRNVSGNPNGDREPPNSVRSRRHNSSILRRRHRLDTGHKRRDLQSRIYLDWLSGLLSCGRLDGRLQDGRRLRRRHDRHRCRRNYFNRTSGKGHLGRRKGGHVEGLDGRSRGANLGFALLGFFGAGVEVVGLFSHKLEYSAFFQQSGKGRDESEPLSPTTPYSLPLLRS